jgi:hypothetical protein
MVQMLGETRDFTDLLASPAVYLPVRIRSG